MADFETPEKQPKTPGAPRKVREKGVRRKLFTTPDSTKSKSKSKSKKAKKSERQDVTQQTPITKRGRLNTDAVPVTPSIAKRGGVAQAQRPFVLTISSFSPIQLQFESATLDSPAQGNHTIVYSGSGQSMSISDIFDEVIMEDENWPSSE